MKLKKYRRYDKILLTLILSMVLISSIVLHNTIIVQSYTISGSGVVYANQTANERNFHINSIVQLQNGDLYAAHQNTSVHSGTSGHFTSERSTDNGATWANGGNHYYPCGGALAHVMPNGSLIVTMKTSTGIKYMKSFDNGSTFTSAEWFAGAVNNNQHIISPARYDESTGNMFMPVYENDATYHFIYNTTDNGKTWTYYSTIASGLQGHYTTLLQTENSSWTCVIHSSYTTLTYQVWSEDDCLTWNNPKDISSFANIRNPHIEMGSTDNANPYILFGRDMNHDLDFYIYNSSDGVNWGNAYRLEDDEGSGHSAYSWGVNMKNEDFFISYSYLVTYPWAGLKYIKLYDFGDPPYEIRPWENSDNSIQFVSIDGNTNDTSINTSNPVFNWTIDTDAIAYKLQIATDSDFSSIVTDLADINEYNFPSEYSENSTHVSFTLPSANSLSGFSVYYFRVRTYK